MVNRLKHIYLEKGYHCMVQPSDERCGLVIARKNYLAQWISLPTNPDYGIKLKMFNELIDTGNVFFDKHGIAPGVVLARSSGPVSEGGNGMVYSVAAEDMEALSEDLNPPREYSFKLFRNSHGQRPVKGVRFEGRWNSRPLDDDLATIMERKLTQKVRRYSENLGVPKTATISLLAGIAQAITIDNHCETF